MKHILLTSILLLATITAFTAEKLSKEATVVLRDGKKLVEKVVTLENLIADDVVDGEYFKVVEDTQTDAVSFSASAPLVLRAATVYYHLEKARKYYKKLGKDLDLDFPEIDKKIIIRVEQTTAFSSVIQFRLSTPYYNGSHTIPSSGNMAMNSWDQEIWFHKAKRIKRNNSAKALGSFIDSRQFKDMMMGQLLVQDVVMLLNELSIKRQYFTKYDAYTNLIGMAFTIGLTELFPKILRVAGLFKKTEYLDAALIPEIIYHEYTHIALSDKLGVRKITAVIEGYPNYAAYKISGLEKLAGRDGKHGKGFQGKKAKSKLMYSFSQEFSGRAALGSYVYSLLYELDRTFGAEAEKIIFTALKYIDGSSDVRIDFAHAILQAIDDVGINKKALKVKAMVVFDKKGL